MSTVVGTVRRLHRYPVKSVGGEEIRDVDVGRSGLEGDRRWALVADEDGAPVTARTAPELRRLTASFQPDGAAVRDADGGVHRGEAALGVLAKAAGMPVRWDETDTSHADVAAVHVVSDGAATAPDAPTGCDPDPRANVVLDLPDAGAERTWIGRRLRIGPVELRVTRTPKHCLGVYADVLVPGRIETGDEVELFGD